MNQCIRLMESLVTFSFTRPVKEVQLALIGVITILGNIRSVRQSYSLEYFSNHLNTNLNRD